jgi:hypothetical protein
LNRLLQSGVVARDEVENWHCGADRKRSRYRWRLA